MVLMLLYKSSVARGYFSDPFGASISNLPTAGACDQRVGVALSNLPTAGVCDQRVLDLLYSIQGPSSPPFVPSDVMKLPYFLTKLTQNWQFYFYVAHVAWLLVFGNGHQGD